MPHEIEKSFLVRTGWIRFASQTDMTLNIRKVLFQPRFAKVTLNSSFLAAGKREFLYCIYRCVVRIFHNPTNNGACTRALIIDE